MPAKLQATTIERQVRSLIKRGARCFVGQDFLVRVARLQSDAKPEEIIAVRAGILQAPWAIREYRLLTRIGGCRHGLLRRNGGGEPTGQAQRCCENTQKIQFVMQRRWQQKSDSIAVRNKIESVRE